MLLDKLRRVRKTIETKTEMQRKAAELQDYMDFLGQLNALIPSSSNIAHRVQLLRRRDKSLTVEVSTTYRRKVADLLKAYEEGQTSFDRTFPEKLKTELDNKTNELRDNWRNYVDRETATLRETLEALKGVLEDPHSVNRAISELQTVKSTMPSTQEQVESLDRAMASASSVINGLNAGPEVQEFLRRVAENRARLSDITEATHQWLSQQGLLSRLRVAFPRAQGS